MRQTLILASLHIAYHLGIRQQAYKIERKCGMNSTQLLDAVQPYVTRLTGMVEIAEEVAMGRPDRVADKVYGGFGKWLGDFISGSEKFPEQEMIEDAMRNAVTQVFAEMLTRTQQDTLKKKLDGV